MSGSESAHTDGGHHHDDDDASEKRRSSNDEIKALPETHVVDILLIELSDIPEVEQSAYLTKCTGSLLFMLEAGIKLVFVLFYGGNVDVSKIIAQDFPFIDRVRQDIRNRSETKLK